MDEETDLAVSSVTATSVRVKLAASQLEEALNEAAELDIDVIITFTDWLNTSRFTIDTAHIHDTAGEPIVLKRWTSHAEVFERLGRP